MGDDRSALGRWSVVRSRHARLTSPRGLPREQQSRVVRTTSHRLKPEVIRILPDDLAHKGVVLALGEGKDLVLEGVRPFDALGLPLRDDVPPELAVGASRQLDRRALGGAGFPGTGQAAPSRRGRRGGRRGGWLGSGLSLVAGEL